MAGISYGEQIMRLAAAEPGKPAIIAISAHDSETTLTYGELNDAADRVAAGLMAQGVTPECLVVIALPNGHEFYIALIAIWRLGACPVPLKRDLTSWERGRYLETIAPSVIIGDWDDLSPDIPVLRMSALLQSRSDAGAIINRIPDRAWAIASGGSTGQPKLIVNLRQATIDWQFAMIGTDEIVSHEVQLICAPTYHTHGLSLSVRTLMAGGTLVVTRNFEARQVLRLIERFGVSVVGFVPTMLHRVLRVVKGREYDVSSLRCLITGSGAIPASTINLLVDLIGAQHIYVGYGASEGIGGTMIRGDELLQRPGSVGLPIAAEIRILGPDNRPLPPGQVGEIYLRSFAGDSHRFEYRGAPPPTCTSDGFVTVGDMGWLDDDGYLYIADRRTDMIKTRGVNVFPAEVEAALMESPDVNDVAVIGLPDSEWGRRLHAIVVPAEPGRPPCSTALTAFCRTKLASLKIPKSFEMVESLPRTEIMKLNRSALVEARLGSPDGVGAHL